MPTSPGLQRLILATLAGLPVASCGLVCDADQKDFALQADAAAWMLVSADVGADGQVDDAQCARICSMAYAEETGWSETEVRDCAVDVDTAAWEEAWSGAEAGDTADAGDTAEDTAGVGDRDERVVGEVTCTGHGVEYYCKGRRPLGHVEAAGAGDDDLGRVLATLAHLEAASVTAFEELAAFLVDHGAPAALVARCRAAAEDERRHARWLAALARERGAVVPAPRTEPCPTDLRAVAMHNGVEGCVHEAWAALEAHLAAARAHDPRLRTAWARIARDETAHAQLSWDLHVWLLPQLSAADRAAVRAAQAEALARLPARARATAAAVPRALGFPTLVQAEVLATDLAARLAA